jgi:hypothetical protein
MALRSGGHLEAEGLVRRGCFERPGGEEQPAIVWPPKAVTRWRRQSGIGEGIGQIATDGGALGHHRLAVAKRRHLAHRIDGEVVRRLHRRAVVEQLGAIRATDLLEHPTHDATARHRVGVKDHFVGHAGHPSVPCIVADDSARHCQSFKKANGRAWGGKLFAERALAHHRAEGPRRCGLQRGFRQVETFSGRQIRRGGSDNPLR